MNPSKTKVTQVRRLESLMTCTLTHEVDSTTASYEWNGPKFTREMWNEMLAFFRWNHGVTKSEAQVRLYVNHRTKEWKAWAFPQKAGLGMSARELEAPWGPEQFAFSEADGWLYYGTVHDHAMAGAFQSGTDEANERKIDGLHITVGNLDAVHYSIHARLYQSGFKLSGFQLSDFWDIGNALAGIPGEIFALLPGDARDQIAGHQMGVPPPPETAFPEIWKANIISEPPALAVGTFFAPGKAQFPKTQWVDNYTDRSERRLAYDFNRCLEDLQAYLASNPGMSLRSATATIASLAELLDDDARNLFDLLCRHDVEPEHFLDSMDELERNLELAEQQGTQPHSMTKEIPGGLTDVTDYDYGYGYGLQ